MWHFVVHECIEQRIVQCKKQEFSVAAQITLKLFIDRRSLMKYLSIWVVCVFALAVTAFSVFATPAKRYDATTGTCRTLNDGPLEWESRSWGEGGKTFKQFCKSCHSRDNNRGGTFLWEESKTSQGWNNVFAQRRAKCARDGVWDEISSDRLLMVNDFLYRWASNSVGRHDSA